MRSLLLITALGLCVACNHARAQDKPRSKPGIFSFNFNYSDYSFIRTAQDSSFSSALKREGIFRSGNSSFGVGVSYWRSLGSHVDLSGNLSGVFSNFPATFIKDDSIGQAGFTTQLDALLHFRALQDHSSINPFLTAGAGVGYFGKQFAAYAPLGTGLQFHFNDGVFIFIQAQWRMALTKGINSDYMFYSVGFAQQAKQKPSKKKPAEKPLPATDTMAVINEAEKDTDGDGILDLADVCPDLKGTINGCPDRDGDGLADKDDQCPDLKGIANYNGCPVPDTDADGINDEEDNCKTEAGVKENNGCPPLPADTDKDGVIDTDDKCPDIAGTHKDGCPIEVLEGATLLKASADSMRYAINFDIDRANINVEAFAVLAQVVRILKADPKLHIRIEGHADSTGTERYNMQISAERAYLLSYNVGKNRIQTAWYGSSRPLDLTQDWRNRRVEITFFRK
jgi:OmpA-OmpF porin, OOP family